MFPVALVLLILLNAGFILRFLSEKYISKALRGEKHSTETSVFLSKAKELDPRTVQPLYSSAEEYLFSGDFYNFYAAADRIEERIPRFRGITLMRASAKISQNRYHEAVEILKRNLDLDQFDINTEVRLLFIHAIINDWSEVKKTFTRIIQNDFFIQKYEAVELSFPEETESVKRYMRKKNTVIEFGTASMEKVIRQILSTTQPHFDLYFFRFHYVLGNVYSSFELPEFALKHFTIGKRDFLAATEYFRSTNQLELIESEPGRGNEQTKYQHLLFQLSNTLNGLIENNEESGFADRVELYLLQYLFHFKDQAKYSRLESLYRKQLRFKALKRLQVKYSPSTVRADP